MTDHNLLRGAVKNYGSDALKAELDDELFIQDLLRLEGMRDSDPDYQEAFISVYLNWNGKDINIFKEDFDSILSVVNIPICEEEVL